MKHNKISLCILLLFAFSKTSTEPKAQQAEKLFTNNTNQSFLVNYIAQREAQLKEMNKHKSSLHELAYRSEQQYHYTYPYYAGLYELICKEIIRFENETISQTTEYLNAGAPLGAVDNKGKTALDYVSSYKMYHVLRSHGANFQLKPFIYFHPKTTIVESLLIATILYNISEKIIEDFNNLIYKKNDSCNHENHQNYDTNNLHSKDSSGRTPLMNYIIDQELVFVELRAHIENLEKDPSNKNSYYDAIIKHQTLCNTTKKKIKTMIDQGSCLHIKDIYGKNLSDYCQTKEIYYLLRNAGAPCSYKTWLYFEGRNSCITISASLLTFIAFNAYFTYKSL